MNGFYMQNSHQIGDWGQTVDFWLYFTNKNDAKQNFYTKFSEKWLKIKHYPLDVRF